MNRRIYLITGNELRVFEWHNQTLYTFYSFDSSPQSRLQFADYLRSAPSMLSKILVDLLDEEFQHEKIPHLRGKNKSSVIQRQVNKHYRDAAYTYARVTGRDKNGRRDDELLLTSITNSEALDDWIKILNDHRIPIIGIWSLPLLSEDLLAHISKEAKNFLLVSKQVDNVLRESFFKDRKLYISRHIKTDTNEMSDANSYLSKGIEQIHKFLSNQRVIPFGKKMEVFCLVPEKLLENAKLLFPNTDAIEYHFRGIGELFKLNKINCKLPQNSDILFSYLCSRRTIGSDQYGTKSLNKAFHQYLLRKLFNFSSSFGAIIMIALACFIHISAKITISETDSLNNFIGQLERVYATKYSPIEKKLLTANLVQESVAFHKILERESKNSPEDFFIPLSSIFDQPLFSALQLESFDWKKMHGAELDQLRQDIWLSQTPNLTQFSEYEYNENEADDNIPVVTLTGTLADSNMDYRTTVNTMEKFVQALNNLSDVVQLVVIRTPVDIRITSQFSDQGGMDRTLLAGENRGGQYEIKLLLKPSQPNSISAADHE